MSNVAPPSPKHSLHPAKDGWKPIVLQSSYARVFAPSGVTGAGSEALFLDDAERLFLGESDLLLRDWLGFLESVQEPNGDLARALWNELSAARSRRVPIPQAGPLPDGGFQFVWDRGEHHLEIDILPDRSFEWFYRNRRTEAIAGDDLPAGHIPDEVKARLDLFE